MQAEPSGNGGKDPHLSVQTQPAARPQCRRSARTQARSGPEILTSMHYKLALRKAAARGIRREYRRKVGGRNSGRPQDFEAREPLRATGMFPMG